MKSERDLGERNMRENRERERNTDREEKNWNRRNRQLGDMEQVGGERFYRDMQMHRLAVRLMR